MTKKDKENRPATMSVLTKLLNIKLIAKIASKIFDSYERVWDTQAITERSAMAAITPEVENFYLSGEKIAEMLQKSLTPNDIVLDIGCGIGRIEKPLAKYCAEIHGVDVSTKMVKFAKRQLKGMNNVYIYKTNGKDLSLFADGKFDFVFSIIVLQHLEKEDAVFYLLEIYRVLKPSGKLYFNVPNFFDEGNFRKFMEKYVKNPSSRTAIKMRYYCPDEIKKIVTSVGFDIVSIRTNKYIEVLAKKGYKVEDKGSKGSI